MCNTTIVMVTRSPLNVTLYIRCISCYSPELVNRFRSIFLTFGACTAEYLNGNFEQSVERKSKFKYMVANWNIYVLVTSKKQKPSDNSFLVLVTLNLICFPLAGFINLTQFGVPLFLEPYKKETCKFRWQGPTKFWSATERLMQTTTLRRKYAGFEQPRPGFVRIDLVTLR